MRLSEIKGERVFEVIADIIEPACNIAQDKEAMALFDRSGGNDGKDSTEQVLSRVKGAVPKLMRTHRDDLVAILAAIEGVDPEQYMEGITMPKLVQGVFEMLTDEDLLAFLS